MNQPDPKARQAIRRRTQAFMDQVWRQDLPAAFATSAGTVEISSIDVSESDGVAVLDIGVVDPEGGDPHFRIINPPTLVADPHGDIVLRGGTRARVDPVRAVTEAIAMHGGARKSPRR